eukprot:250874_1
MSDLHSNDHLSPNFTNITLSDEEPISRAINIVLQMKNKHISPNDRTVWIQHIISFAKGDSIGCLRALQNYQWKKIINIPLICRIYLRKLIKQSKNLHLVHLKQTVPNLFLNYHNLQNLKNVLDAHSGRIPNAQNIINNCDLVILLDDFLYLVEYPFTTKQLQAMHDYFGHCNAHHCDLFKRHKRVFRSVQTKEVVSNVKDKIIAQILGKMHTYLYHNKSSSDNTNNDKTSVESPSRYKQLFEDSINISTDSFGMYCCGMEFYYGYKDERKHQDTIYTQQKFSSLKEELVSNNVHRMLIQQFNNEYRKAKIHYSSYHKKKTLPEMPFEHILTIMIYCNYDQLQYEFSKTYRSDDKTKHNNFYHYGKNIKQSVHRFGHTMSERNVKSLFHGVNQYLVLSKYVGHNDGLKINVPLSTTTNFRVAANFAGYNNGLIIEFGDDDRRYFSAKYFPCDWLSDFPRESECLLIQNFNLLKLRNITIAYSGIQCKHILTGLYVINELTISSAHIVGTVDPYMRILVHSLMEVQLSIYLPKYKNVSFSDKYVYIAKMIQGYFESRVHVKMCYVVLTSIFKSKSILFDTSCDGLNLVELITLFPNIISIEISSIPMSMKAFNKLIEDLKYVTLQSQLQKILLTGISDGFYHAISLKPPTIIDWKLQISSSKTEYYLCIQKCHEIDAITLQSLDAISTSCGSNHSVINISSTADIVPANRKSSVEKIRWDRRLIRNHTIVSKNQSPQNHSYSKKHLFLCSRLSKCLIEYYDHNHIPSAAELVQLLDDFIYLLELTKDDVVFEEIYQHLQINCSLNTCIAFSRHSQKQTDSSKFQKDMEINDTAIEQLMDKIHCHWAHSFDLGYRLNSSNRLLLNKLTQNLSDQSNTHNDSLLNKTLIHRKKMLSIQTSIPDSDSKSSHTISRSVDKYNQLNSSNMLQDAAGFYSFGFQFYYGDMDSYMHRDIIVISPKYESLKEELTCNNICILTVKQFQNEYVKAKYQFNTTYRKQNYPTIQLSFVLSMMIYCNFDTLQNELSKTYRNNNGCDHNNFYHWGKYLKQIVHIFGNSVSSERLCINSNTTKFFHGVGEKLLFPKCIGHVDGVRIFVPLSTSSSFSVATNFTNYNNGIVIQFGDDNRRYFTPKYYPCRWLSDYPAEEECFFIQNVDLLKISNIYNVTEGYEYEKILTALYILNELTIESEDIIGYVDPFMVKFLTKIINDHNKYLNQTFQSLCPYAKKMVDTYCNNRKSVILDYHVLNNESFLFLCNMVFCRATTTIKLKELDALFPNLEFVKILGLPFTVKSLNRLFLDMKTMHSASNIKTIIFAGTNDETFEKIIGSIPKYQQLFRSIDVNINEHIDWNGDYHLCIEKQQSTSL